MTKRFAILVASALALGAFLILAHETARWLERRGYPDTALHDAVKWNALQELPELIAMGFDIEDQNDRGETVLLTLVKRGPNGKPKPYLAALETLLEARADANATDKKGRSPVHLAIARGGPGRKDRHPQIEALAMLLKHGADPNASDPDGWSPLALAGRRDLKDAETLLIEAGAIIGAEEAVAIGDVNAFRHFLERDSSLAHRRFTDLDLTLLLLAAIEDEPEMVRLLIEAGADPNYQDLEANGALHHAIQTGASDEIVGLLLDAGADPNLPDGYGRSPLHLASGAADSFAAKMLLEAGADVGLADRYNRSPLFYVNDVGLAKTLIQHGADVSVQGINGDTLLHSVIRSFRLSENSLALAEIYLSQGLDGSVRDHAGYAPLDRMVIGGAVVPHEWVVLLERYGVRLGLVATLQSGRTENALDILQQDPEQASEAALAAAIRAEEPEIARRILDLGVDPNAGQLWNYGGGPFLVSHFLDPVMYLANGNPEMAIQMVGLLLEYGIDPDANVHSGPALVYAVRYRQGVTVKQLLESGADPNAPDQDGRTALDFSMKRGLDDITELLIAHGARPGRANAAAN